MNVICLVVDRLHAGYLGCYGNGWIRTPAVDRLATESYLFDQAYIDSPALTSVYRSYWTGQHALCPHDAPEARPTLPGALRSLGFSTALLSDEPELTKCVGAGEFDELLAIDPPWNREAVTEIEQTHLASCFVEMIDYLESAPQKFFLWAHLGGLGTVWDAPLELRRMYQDEGDPEVPTAIDAPDRMLDEDFDPDERLGISQSYAGQISVFDAGLDALLGFMESAGLSKNTALILTSPRGYPLGEHRRVGQCDDALHNELVQAPLLIRFPDGLGAARRTQALTEPSDLYATILDAQGFAVPDLPSGTSLMPVIREEVYAVRDRLLIGESRRQRALRTPGWYYLLGAHGELYAKPDDRWEVNDVSNRCMEVMECLHDAMTLSEQTLHSGRLADLPALNEALLSQ